VTDRSPVRGDRFRLVVASALVLLVGATIPLPSRLARAPRPLGPDKLLHLVAHAEFAAALAAALTGSGPTRRGAVAAVVVSTAFGFVTERLQEAIPGRRFEWGDVVAGFLGSVLGVLGWQRRVLRATRDERRRHTTLSPR